jgi:hypothetical protein
MRSYVDAMSKEPFGMTHLDRRGAFYLTCMAIAILSPLLFYWRERLWTLWVWLWN